jgi:hypothetical protein
MMKKFVLFFLLNLVYSNISIADTPYNLIQINCYEKSGYFELRRFDSQNLNMYQVSEDGNLISLFGENKEYESITKECVFPKWKFVENQITVIVTIYPFCKIPYKGIPFEGSDKKCTYLDAKFDIQYVDEKGKKKFIEKGQFLIDDELTTRRIRKIEFLPKDLYFVIHFEENTNPGYILEKIVKKEVTIFLPDSSFPSDYKYPLTSDDLVKMF